MEELLFSHDRFFKQAISNRKVAQEFFQRHLPTKMLDKVDLNTLQIKPNSYLDDHLKASMSDILFSTTIANQPGYLYLLVEHQSSVDHLLPFRLLKYMVAVIAEHMKNNEKNALPLVYPLVFYNGKKRYTGSLDLFSLFADPTLAKDILCKPFQLIDVGLEKDAELGQYVWSGVMELVMKHIYARDFLPYLGQLMPLLKKLEFRGQVDYIQAIFCYTLSKAETKQKQKVIETFRTGLTQSIGENAMTIAEELRAEGKAEGIQAGLLKGKAEGIKAVALNLLRLGNEVSYVSEVTGLPVALLQSLLENMTEIDVH